MKNVDKVALLFEMLIGTDMVFVNDKVERIKFSPEYSRLYRAAPMLSKTQSLNDVAIRFNNVDLYGIMSLQKALEIEREIKELDKRLKRFPSINPYLSDGKEKDYNIRTLGDIGVEINAQGMPLDEFMTYKGVLTANRKKILKMKAFTWYKEAKVALLEMVDNSKLMLRKIRHGRINYFSLLIQFYLSLAATLGLIFYLGFIPANISYRTNSNLIFDILVIFSLFTFGVVSIIHTFYRYYPFRVASDVRKQISKQEELSKKLDDVSEKFERRLLDKAANAEKLDVLLKKMAIIGNSRQYNPIDLLDYAYSEKEFFYNRFRVVLIVYNVAFVISFSLSTILLFIKVLNLI
jgi:hypothetical protein